MRFRIELEDSNMPMCLVENDEVEITAGHISTAVSRAIKEFKLPNHKRYWHRLYVERLE
jgi:hypothetical protein